MEFNKNTSGGSQSETSLSNIYSEALKVLQVAQSLPRGDKRQESYDKARLLFERSGDMVETLSLFSDNETVEDIATANLKYLLIPAYLAKIAVSSECIVGRLETFNRAKLLIEQFLQRVENYGFVIPSHTTTTPGDLESAMRSRTEKIERYKNLKALEDKIKEFDRRVSSGEHVDEEETREHYLNLIKKCVENSFESLEMEIKPAILFETSRGSHTNPVQAPKASFPIDPTKSLTIVKDNLQKKVFGLGYPSKPTVTVDEFISKKINDGDLAFQTQKEVYSNSLQRYAEQPNLRKEQEELSDTEREEKEERDDAEELTRRRNWDEFKDENPRGSGNRHNMG